MYYRAILILIISLVSSFLSSCDSNSHTNKKMRWNGRHWVEDNRPQKPNPMDEFRKKQQKKMLEEYERQYHINTSDDSPLVYICTGNDAYAYHYNADCSGLNNCSDEIEIISQRSAKRKGRTPCEICCK